MLSNFKYTKGFTLVEMLVSLGIMVGIYAVVLSNEAAYTNRAAIANVADEINLSLREAQTYGVGVKEFTPGSTEFDVSYGLSFNTTSGGSDDAYIFFGDRGVLNGRYDSGWSCTAGTSSECLSKTMLSHNIRISDVCYIRNNGSESCVVGGVDITYKRPDTNANLKFFNPSGNEIPAPNVIGARIEISSPAGFTRSVMVYTTGQISVQ